MATETLTPEQKRRLDDLAQNPDMVNKAFGYFTATQVEAYKARLKVWTFEVIAWRVLSLLGLLGIFVALNVPAVNPYLNSFLIAWGASTIFYLLLGLVMPSPGAVK